MSNDLVNKASNIFFGSAVAGAGFSLGRDTYKFIKKKFIIAIIVLILLGSLIFSFLSSSKTYRWYPYSLPKWLFLVLLPWTFLGCLGFAGLYILTCIFYDLFREISLNLLDENYWNNDWTVYSVLIFISLYLLGVIDALRRRGKRKIVHDVILYNTNFMEKNGLIEIDSGGGFTHKDRDGNLLRIDSIGRDIIVFFAYGKRNKRAYIDIDKDGKFAEYSGIVSI